MVLLYRRGRSRFPTLVNSSAMGDQRFVAQEVRRLDALFGAMGGFAVRILFIVKSQAAPLHFTDFPSTGDAYGTLCLKPI